MIVCHCNVLTDHDVRNVVSAAENAPRTTGQVYGCLGCSAQCGRCARTIRRIMNEALVGACTESCAVAAACAHAHHAEPDNAEPADEEAAA